MFASRVLINGAPWKAVYKPDSRKVPLLRELQRSAVDVVKDYRGDTTLDDAYWGRNANGTYML